MREIGIASLNYRNSGEFINGTFTPTMAVTIDNKAMEMFTVVKCNTSEEHIKEQAEAVFATWFQAINDIELADREQFKITSEFAEPCTKYENGSIKTCKVKFSLTRL